MRIYSFIKQTIPTSAQTHRTRRSVILVIVVIIKLLILQACATQQQAELNCKPSSASPPSWVNRPPFRQNALSYASAESAAVLTSDGRFDPAATRTAAANLARARLAENISTEIQTEFEDLVTEIEQADSVDTNRITRLHVRAQSKVRLDYASEKDMYQNAQCRVHALVAIPLARERALLNFRIAQSWYESAQDEKTPLKQKISLMQTAVARLKQTDLSQIPGISPRQTKIDYVEYLKLLQGQASNQLVVAIIDSNDPQTPNQQLIERVDAMLKRLNPSITQSAFTCSTEQQCLKRAFDSATDNVLIIRLNSASKSADISTLHQLRLEAIRYKNKRKQGATTLKSSYRETGFTPNWDELLGRMKYYGNWNRFKKLVRGLK